MQHFQRILCTGDPILDIYKTEKGELKPFNGGALNIYQNILALIEYHFNKTAYAMFAYPNSGDFLKGDIYNCYTILRHHSYPGVEFRLSDNSNKDLFYEPGTIQKEICEFKPQIMVLGDYNKGTLNASSYDDSTHPLPDIDYTIVDSRYKTLDLNWLSTSKTSLWHATNKEYDPEWGENFDYIFWTDGPNPVKVLKDNKLIGTITVPSTQVVDSCGCGDTFTATIAACLAIFKECSDEAILKYAEFAVEVCQDVLTKPFTATTSKRINKECTLQTLKKLFTS
tara:strand:+ start:83 stop:928 length:846 start_codon:yes stop_codon:yes gene_type:complete